MSSTRLAVAAVVIAAPVVVAGMELSPTWPLYHLPWPEWYWYALVLAGGLLGGGLLAGRQAWAGVPAGAIGTLCATFAIAYVLDRSGFTSGGLIVLIGLFAGLPGYGLYCLLTVRMRTVNGGERWQNIGSG